MLVNRECKREMFTKSRGEVLLSMEEMVEKLKNVIKFTILPVNEENSPRKCELKSATEREQLIKEQKIKLKKSIFKLRLKVLTDQKKKEVLPKLLEDPTKLINCKILHKIKESSDDLVSWNCPRNREKVSKVKPETSLSS